MTREAQLPAAALALAQAAVAQGEDAAGSAVAVAVSVAGQRFVADLGRTSRARKVALAADAPGSTAKKAAWRDQVRPGVPVDAATRFDVASLTKPMATLTLLAQALSHGGGPTPGIPLVSLDDPLERHLAEARGCPIGKVRIGHLVSHASGLPAWRDFTDAATAAEAKASPLDPPGRSRCAGVLAAVLATPLLHAPGTKAIYSDLGYLALGWLLESVYRTPIDDLFAGRVAAPLGLRAGYRRLSDQPIADEAAVATEIIAARCPDGRPLQGSVHDDNAALLDGVAGHAGLFACSRDVLTWAEAWLDLLEPKATDRDGDLAAGPLAIAPAIARQLVASPGAPASSWRHGWDTPSQPGSTAGALAPPDTFGHLGFTGTSVWLSPGQRVAIVLLTNRVHPDRARVAGIRALRPALHDALWNGLVPCESR